MNLMRLRLLAAIVVGVSAVSSASAGVINLQIMTLETFPNHGAGDSYSPMNPASGTVYSHSSSNQSVSTWIAGKWTSAGAIDVWYATNHAGAGGSSKATATFYAALQSSAPLSVSFTPHQLAGTNVSAVVMVGTQSHTFTTGSTSHSYSNYGTEFMTVTYTVTGMHQHAFNTSGPRVGGTLAFQHTVGGEQTPVPGVGFGAIVGVGLMARRRRR